MKTKFNIIPAFLIAITFMVFSSCSKSKNSENEPIKNAKTQISMKIDGAEWTSTTTTMLTKNGDPEEAEDGRIVLITAVRGAAGDESESLLLFIHVPASKLNNPKGTYAVATEEVNENRFWGTYTKTLGDESAIIYMSADPMEEQQVSGSLEITDFEFGDQPITGEKGYSKLTGKFQMDLFTMSETGKKIKITDGKFSLKSGFGFGF